LALQKEAAAYLTIQKFGRNKHLLQYHDFHKVKFAEDKQFNLMILDYVNGARLEDFGQILLGLRAKGYISGEEYSNFIQDVADSLIDALRHIARQPHYLHGDLSTINVM